MRRTATSAPLFRCFPLLLTLGLLLSGLAPRPAQAQASQGQVADSTELRVLRQFYWSTGGPHWTDHSGWPATDSAWARATLTQAAGWAGVMVSDGDVWRLFYRGNNNLSGALPASLGELGGLYWLYISDNPSLGGPLPASMARLQHLGILGLVGNQFDGPLPAWLGQLSSLSYLVLNTNRFTGPIPPELGQLSNLQILSLDNLFTITLTQGNRLTGGIPKELGQLHNLRQLALDMNPLGGPIPPELSQLTQLQSLELDDCGLTGSVPASLLNLPQLTTLILGNSINLGNLAALGSAPNPYYHNPNHLRLPDPGQLSDPARLQLQLEYNQFDFGDLEPYFTAPGQLLSAPGSTYAPQGAPLLAPQPQQLLAGQALELYGGINGTLNHYQWQRQVGGQWLDLAGQTGERLRWDQVTTAQTGRYRARVTNELVTGLTLYSPVFWVDVLPYFPLSRNQPNDSNLGFQAFPVSKPAADAAAARPADLNYVRSWVPRQALTQASDVPAWTVEQAGKTTQYLDGLGRPLQTVLHQASPRRQDMVQLQVYDGLGREPRAYLPYADSAALDPLGYHARPLSHQLAFYSPDRQPGPPNPQALNYGVARTASAFAETQFEASPLNRVLSQGAAGEAWQLTSGHITERQERPNTAQDTILYFRPGYDPQSLDPGYQGLYAPGELWGVQVNEPKQPDAPGEQGYATIEWKDKLGQVVGKQVEAARDGSMNQGTRSRWLRTAYVYDDFPRLRFVVQPEGTRRLLAPPAPAATPAPDPAPALGEGLQLLLPLDEAAGQQAADGSGQGHPGQLAPGNGQATWLPQGGHDGRGGALQLTGGARLTVPLNWQPTRFTVSFWLKPLTRADYGQQTGAGQGWGGWLFHSSFRGNLYVGTDVASRLALSNPDVVEAGVWQHFAFTFDQGVATLYKDGQVLASRPDMALPQAWQGFVLGLSGDEVYDEVRVYDRPLTASEVSALAQAVVVARPAGTVADYLFHYRYDSRGRQIAKQVPGQAGETLVVYDQLDRPVMSQDAQQRLRREWSWSKYDALGRVVLTGLVTRADTAGQVTLQNLAAADTATAHQYEQRTADAAFAQHYTTGQAFPRLGQQGFGAGRVLTASYYDDYDFDNDGQADADGHYLSSSDAAFAAGTAPVADEARVTGLPTRTLTRVLNQPSADPGAEWLSATMFYDERGRVIQTQSTNARGGQDVVTLQLDFLGKPLRSVASHQGPSLPAPIQVVETMKYDHAERLLTTSQQLPGEAAPVPLSRRAYNEIGQLLVDSLASGRLAQNVKYAYNIRGWLVSLNNPYQPAPGDLFNLSLHYESGFGFGYEQYNGNLTGQTWRGRDGVQRAYGYVYDPLNRLLQGDYLARGPRTPTSYPGEWGTEADNYRLSFVSYDDNGNILTLRRQGLLQAATHNMAKQYGAVDNLTYAYQGNRLQAVEDQVTGNQRPQPASYHGAPTSLAGDFQEGTMHQGQEYGYDANGNLTQDKNKNITGIVYNHLNLPRQIHFGQVGDSVVFRYTASGQKVAKLVYQTGQPAQRTDYLGPYQYEGDSLRFFPHAAGRVLRFVSYDAAKQPTVSYQREYTVKDHLGNLRLAYRAGQVRRLLATLEQDETTHKRESQQFDSLSVSAPVAVSTGLAHSGTFAARLNAGGSTPQPLGPLTQLGVQKGDTVSVQAFGYYAQATQHGFMFSLASFIANLFHPAQAPPPGLEAQKRQGFPILQVGVAAGLASIPQLSGGVPKGYLRVLVFNKDSALVRQRTWQLSQVANGGYEPLGDTVRVSQDGYVTVYVGNESDVDVLFDDVSVEHRQGLQVQETQYDPAGLELAGLVAPSPGIRGLNNYRFNGKEFQADLGLGWNHQDWRFFDPQLLRWHSGDPEVENGQESWTPYSFGYDNAVRYSDADGREPDGGPGKPMAQIEVPLSEFAKFVEELVPAVENSAIVVGLAAAGAWIGNHLPSAQQVGEVLSAGNGDAYIPAGVSSVPQMRAYVLSQSGLTNRNANSSATNTGNATNSTSQSSPSGSPKPDRRQKAERAAAKAADGKPSSGGTDFIVNSKGEALPIPNGATGPTAPQKGGGMTYQGGRGGKGMNTKTTGVRIMDADANQGRRVNYMNVSGQTTDPASGHTIGNKDPRGHIPYGK